MADYNKWAAEVLEAFEQAQVDFDRAEAAVLDTKKPEKPEGIYTEDLEEEKMESDETGHDEPERIGQEAPTAARAEAERARCRLRRRIKELQRLRNKQAPDLIRAKGWVSNDPRSVGSFIVDDREVAIAHSNEAFFLEDPTILPIWCDGSWLAAEEGVRTAPSAGAGVIYKPRPLHVVEKGYVPSEHTIESSDGAERFALYKALIIAVDEARRSITSGTRFKKIEIFTDSQGSLGRLKKSKFGTEPYEKLLKEAFQSVVLLERELSIEVQFRWVPGHSSAVGNVLADRRAGEASKLGTESSYIRTMTLVSSKPVGS